MIEQFGSAALVVAVVAALNKMLALTARASVIASALSAVIVSIIWSYGNAGGGVPIDWAKLPLDALVAWLTAMGVWSGGKTLVTGSAGSGGK